MVWFCLSSCIACRVKKLNLTNKTVNFLFCHRLTRLYIFLELLNEFVCQWVFLLFFQLLFLKFSMRFSECIADLLWDIPFIHREKIQLFLCEHRLAIPCTLIQLIYVTTFLFVSIHSLFMTLL